VLTPAWWVEHDAVDLAIIDSHQHHSVHIEGVAVLQQLSPGRAVSQIRNMGAGLDLSNVAMASPGDEKISPELYGVFGVVHVQGPRLKRLAFHDSVAFGAE